MLCFQMSFMEVITKGEAPSGMFWRLSVCTLLSELLQGHYFSISGREWKGRQDKHFKYVTELGRDED